MENIQANIWKMNRGDATKNCDSTREPTWRSTATRQKMERGPRRYMLRKGHIDEESRPFVDASNRYSSANYWL